MSYVAPRSAAVIAAYNQEDFILEAALSLADQVDEVIVVDDHSLDRTFDVVAGAGHPGVRAFRNERNLGVSRTFNRAVAETNAEVVLIQGGDDRSLPERAFAQVAALLDTSVSLVYSKPAVINSSGHTVPNWLAPDFFPTALDMDPLAKLLYVNNYICAPAVAVRRADYLAVGGFHGGLDLLQDYAMWLRLAELGKFMEFDRPVVEYRKHGENLSRDYVGIDGPRHRKLRAEQDFVRNNFLRIAEDASLDRLAVAVEIDPRLFSQLERDEKVALLGLAHPDKTVKRTAVAFLVDLAGRPDPDKAFERLGLARADLSRYMFDADHDNMDEVTRALQAGAGAPSPQLGAEVNEAPTRPRSLLRRALSGSPSVVAGRFSRYFRARLGRRVPGDGA